MPAADSHRNSLAGLTLDEVLANRAAASSNHLTTRRTLLDIIREDESNKKDRKSWKAFKDKLRLKRAGSAWTSSILIPASDISIPLHNNRSLNSQLRRRSSVRVLTFSTSDVTTHYMADPPRNEEIVKGSDGSNDAAPTFTRQSSRRQVGDASVDDKLKPQISRPNSARLAAAVRADSIRRERVVTFRDSYDSDDEDDDRRSLRHSKAEGRQMSAREAVAAQEAAEAAAAAAATTEEVEEQEEDESSEAGAGAGTVTMSLMDLLEETDRQMGLEGSRYRMEDDEDEFDDDEYDEEDEGGLEYDCCVCMVKHRSSAFVSCGHTFCRMCSRELTVSKGNCPLCNNFILEILDIF